MPWIESAVAMLEGAHVASEVLSFKEKLRQAAKQLVFWIRNGTCVVPVFGAGGVGKSTLGKLLNGQALTDIQEPYDESWKIEELNLAGDIHGRVLVAPGQIQRAELRWPELYRQIASGNALGIINVVAYGYHSLNIESISEHDVFRSGMSTVHFLQAYTKIRREAELLMLKKLVDGMAALTHPIWMVTLVNKQDLWWPYRQAVREHYEKGEYGRIIDDVTRKIGERSFQHEFIPASLTLENLVTKGGTLIAGVSAGYDLHHHLAAAAFAVEKIEQLAAQGKQQHAT